MSIVQISFRRCSVREKTALCVWLPLPLLLLLLHTSHAFLTSSSPPRLAVTKWQIPHADRQLEVKSSAGAIDSSGSDDIPAANVRSSTPLTHSDIEWRLRPPEGTSRLNRLKLKVGANILRLENKLKGGKLPPVLCPKGGQAVLEAYYEEHGKRKKKIARFGITTSRGPSCEEIDTTIRELYKIDPPPLSAAIAAIIYMFVEPEYRKLGVGSLALEVISAIHSVQAVDFTVLVADDNGSGELVRWYENNGYLKAPLMQNVLGSPDGKFGAAMICPVSVREGFFEQCQVKWW